MTNKETLQQERERRLAQHDPKGMLSPVLAASDWQVIVATVRKHSKTAVGSRLAEAVDIECQWAAREATE